MVELIMNTESWFESERKKNGIDISPNFSDESKTRISVSHECDSQENFNIFLTLDTMLKFPDNEEWKEGLQLTLSLDEAEQMSHHILTKIDQLRRRKEKGEFGDY